MRKMVDAAFAGLPRDRELHLATLFKKIQADRSSTLQAFEAIGMIAAWEFGREDGCEFIPTAMVPVPWWVIQAMAIGYNNYRDQHSKGLITSLGEAFGMEQSGQGKGKRLNKAQKELRNIRLEAGITARVNLGATITAAIEAVIAEGVTSLSSDTIRKIYRQYRALRITGKAP